MITIARVVKKSRDNWRKKYHKNDDEDDCVEGIIKRDEKN